jgi:hypothetical protein
LSVIKVSHPGQTSSKPPEKSPWRLEKSTARTGARRESLSSKTNEVPKSFGNFEEILKTTANFTRER